MIERIWWNNKNTVYLGLKLGEIEERFDILYFYKNFWYRTTVPKSEVTEREEDYSVELFKIRKQNTNPFFKWELP